MARRALPRIRHVDWLPGPLFSPQTKGLGTQVWAEAEVGALGGQQGGNLASGEGSRERAAVLGAWGGVRCPCGGCPGSGGEGKVGLPASSGWVS